MWHNIFPILLLLGSCTAAGYKYPGYRYPCCRWKPVPGPHGYHSENFGTSSYFSSSSLSSSYGAPSPITSSYGPPKPEYGVAKLEYNIAKPVYGVPNLDYGVPKQEYGIPKPVYGVPDFGTHQNFAHNNFDGNLANNFLGNGGYHFDSGFATNGHNFPQQGHDYSLGFNQNLLTPPAPQASFLAHEKVVSATQDESQLPAQLLNPFYKNPAIRDALAKHSWFGPGEKPEGVRETDRISRQRIYEVLHHAGLIKRR